MIALCAVGHKHPPCVCLQGRVALSRRSPGKISSERSLENPTHTYTATSGACRRGRSIRLPRWYVTVGTGFFHLERLCELVQIGAAITTRSHKEVLQ
jgi:hypothetical protein